MIQIQENDVLWRFYKRFYPRMTVPPDPRNLCNYFWKAMGGVVKAIFWDANVFIVSVLFAGIAALLFAWQYWSGAFNTVPSGSWHSLWNVLNIVLFVTSVGFFSICAIACPSCRWFDYWSQRDERVCWVSWTIITVLGFAIIFSMGFVDNHSGWRWYYLVYGLIIEGGIVLAMAAIFVWWYVFLSGNTNLKKNILQYIGSIKNLACPLVKTPESDQKARREAQLNCGDG